VVIVALPVLSCRHAGAASDAIRERKEAFTEQLQPAGSGDSDDEERARDDEERARDDEERASEEDPSADEGSDSSSDVEDEPRPRLRKQR
jgi:hypothetical protein